MPGKRLGDPNKAISTGAAAEEIACQFLLSEGLNLRARNFRTRLGEIDLIMDDGPVLAIVEVRFRKPNALVSPLESITLGKRRKLVRAAHQYLQSHPDVQHRQCRFDVVAIADNIRWVKAAFDA